MIPISKWKWRGLPGHFICADRCIFRLCTDVGKYRISTVGAFYRDLDKQSKTMGELGWNRHYETMVFEIDSDDSIIPQELDTLGVDLNQDAEGNPFKADSIAEQNHMKMCRKWAKKQ